MNKLLPLLALAIVSCSQPQPAAIADQPTVKPAFDATPRSVVPIGDLPQFGAPDALVTIVEFTDYECPYCRKAEATMRELATRHGEDVRFAVAENPLPMHAHAKKAALLALGTGARFESAHHELFDRSSDDSTLDAFASSYAIARPTEDAADPPHVSLARAAKLARDLRVRGTPTFFVNGVRIVGAQPIATFEKTIDEELAHARALVAAGTARRDMYDAVLAEAQRNPAPLPSDEDVDGPDDPAAAVKAGGALYLGSASAPHTILLFTDFECPYCAKLEARLRGLVARRSDVKVLLRHLPLPMHANASIAARAAIAAENQGALDRYAGRLFGQAFDRAALVALAVELGLDRARFERDFDDPATVARLADDDRLAHALGVSGTPTSFVDGRRVRGAQPDEVFVEALDRRP